MGSGSEDLRGQVVLVTGASRGIGAEFATAYARRGADLVLVSRSTEALASLARSLRSQFAVQMHVQALDLTAPGAAQQLFEQVAARGLSIDVLVNNAGVVEPGDVAACDPQQLEALVALNVQAVVGTTGRFLPGMLARGRGTIINVSSTGAFGAIPGMAAYGGSKAFVSSFTTALHAEVAGTGVRVLALCPGSTDTPMVVEHDLPSPTPRRTSGQVVATAFAAVDRGKASVVDGRLNALLARVVTRVIPEPLYLRMARKVTLPTPARASTPSSDTPGAAAR